MSGQRLSRFLDSIPGYGGYRDKERRRESDRLIRERLAQGYRQQADRIGRMLSKMAAERNLTAIEPLDGIHTRLNHFISRLTTATYGYAGLFSDRPVDEAALDQIARFDQGLAEPLEGLAATIDTLEANEPGTDQYAKALETISSTVESLHDRFDMRSQVIDSAKPAPEASVLALLKPETAVANPQPTAYRLHEGDAITYRGENYEIIGRITTTVGDREWRDFQLKGGTANYWLRVPSTADGEFLWQEEVSGQAAEGFSGERSTQSGTSEVIGQSGKSETRALRIETIASPDEDSVIHVYDWGDEQLSLRGTTIDPVSLQVWSREGGSAI